MTYLCQLQQLTGFPVPDHYSRLLSEYPESLRNLQRAEDGSEAEGQVDSVELMSDPNDVIAVNREVRSSIVDDPDGEEFRWPDSILVIGENGEGDFFGLDLTGEYPGVLLYEHQAVEFQEITDSLEEFIELLRESFT